MQDGQKQNTNWDFYALWQNVENIIGLYNKSFDLSLSELITPVKYLEYNYILYIYKVCPAQIIYFWGRLTGCSTWQYSIYESNYLLLNSVYFSMMCISHIFPPTPSFGSFAASRLPLLFSCSLFHTVSIISFSLPLALATLSFLLLPLKC